MWVDSENKRSQIVMMDGFFTGILRNESDYWCGSYVDLKTKNIVCAITKMGGGTWINVHTGKTITAYRGVK